MNNKISVIIPAYNAENTIERCLKSVSDSSVEIIVVIDGRTDNTENICRELKKNISNLKLIVQEENKGQLIARQNGVKNSTGEYIMFLDADDVYCENTLLKANELINKYHEPDLIRFRYTKPNEYDQYKYFDEEKFIEKKDFKELVYPMFLNGYMLNAVLTDCVKRSVFDNIKIRDENIRYGEDMIINFEIFSNIKNAVFSNEILYKYITRNGSVTKTKDQNKLLKNLEDSIKAYSYLYDYLVRWEMFTEENVKIIRDRVIKESSRILDLIKNCY